MKKFFTLVLGLMLTVALFAADRRPTVTVTSARKYAIVIDGKRYFSQDNTINISNLFYGPHEVKVYKMKSRGFFMRKKLIASSTFQLRNSDVRIKIDRYGQLQISESRFGRDWSDHRRGNDRDNDWGNNRDYDKENDHGYGHGERGRDRNF